MPKRYEVVLRDILDERYALQEKWIQAMHMKKGALRKSLKVKAGQAIPESRLDKAAKSKNSTLRRRAALAKTFANMRKKKG
jgi:hypothetical protein